MEKMEMTIGDNGTLVIPPGTRSIGACAFSCKDELKSVFIPRTVRVVEKFAFRCCTNLKRVVFEDGADIIKCLAFADCTSLESVRLPSTLKILEYSAFEGCSALTNIVLPDGLRRIDNVAFEGCSSLKRINIPRGLKRVGASFGTCVALEEIVVPEGMAHVPAIKFPGYVGRAVVLPECVVGLASETFGAANRLVVAPKGCAGSCHLKYVPGGYREVVDFLSEGERRLADERFEPGAFCAWLQKVPKAVFAERVPSTETPLRLLECMRGHTRVLDVRMCGTGSRFCLEALKYLLRSQSKSILEKKRQFCRDLFAPPSRTDTAFLSDRHEMMTYVLSTSFDADWVVDVRPQRDWQKWRWGEVNPMEFLEDDGLWAAMQKDRGAECLLWMGLLGVDVNADAIRKLFCCRTVDCLVAAYQRFPELQAELPLEEVLLGVCGYWDAKSAIKFIRAVERFRPGICARTRDAAGFSPLWYALYRKGRSFMNWQIRDYGWECTPLGKAFVASGRELPLGCESKIGTETDWRKLAEVLVEVGCDVADSQPLGITFKEVSGTEA